MVFSLSTKFDEAQAPMGVEGSSAQHLQEAALTHVIRARAGHENAARAEHLERAEVQFFIAANGGIKVTLALRERGWVQDDGVVLALCRGVILEQVEGISLNPFDLAAVQGSVLVGNFQGRTGTIHAGDLGAVRGEMKGESPLIAENVERFPFGVAGRGGIVLALVEEGSGLLPFQGVELEADGVHGERYRALLPIQKRGGARVKAF